MSAFFNKECTVWSYLAPIRVITVFSSHVMLQTHVCINMSVDLIHTL